MDVFFTSCAEGSLGTKANEIYYPMAQILNERFSTNHYGDGLKQWFLMFVILGDKSQGSDHPERKMYKKKSSELDMRLNVEFDAFKKGGTQQRTYLLYQCMKRSLDIMEEKNIPDLDVSALKADFDKVAEEQGWNKSPQL